MGGVLRLWWRPSSPVAASLEITNVEECLRGIGSAEDVQRASAIVSRVENLARFRYGGADATPADEAIAHAVDAIEGTWAEDGAAAALEQLRLACCLLAGYDRDGAAVLVHALHANTRSELWPAVSEWRWLADARRTFQLVAYLLNPGRAAS